MVICEVLERKRREEAAKCIVKSRSDFFVRRIAGESWIYHGVDLELRLIWVLM